jgi:hydrophobic/amphiphilic exporter-1 (mainly G- bacteria), HAE1 family
MWLTKLAISRRVTISMLIVGLAVLGMVGLSRMPWDLNPKVDFPVVTVTVPYPGANPEEIEQRIIRPLEDQVSVISGVDRVVSQAQENMGNVTVRFKYGVKTEVGAADVRDAIDRTKAEFPTDVKPASLFKLDIGALPVVTLGIMGDRPPKDLRKMVDDVIKPVLGQVSGVAAVSVAGGEEREIQVLADRERLDAAQLSIAGLSQQLTAQNLDVPSGSIKEGVRDYAVRAIGQFQSMDEIRNLMIATPKGKFRLADLAEVQDTVVEPTNLARTNGKAAVGVSVLKQSEANTVAVVDGVKQKLEVLLGTAQQRGTMPRDIKAVVSYDASKRVREAIYDVRDAMLWGAMLAALVVFIFLHNFRGTIIVALAIPTCILATFLPIGLGLGFTLNMMVMLGLALSVGILVDDSIVVLENIERHLQMGEQVSAAAFNGRTEIGAAAVATTSVDVVVYIPVAMMGGIVGQFFYSFGLTVFTCTCFSLLIAFTLTPMLASWWYQRREKGAKQGTGLWARAFAGFDRGYHGLEHAYRGVLHRAIRHPYITVGIGYGLLILAFMAIGPRLGFQFFPRSDAGLLSIEVETAVGTRLEETDRIVRRLERTLLDKKQCPEITDLDVTVGRGAGSFIGGGNQGSRYAAITVSMSGRKERVTHHQRSDIGLAGDLRKMFADIPGATIKVSTSASMGPGGADIQYYVLSNDRAKLDAAAAQLAAGLKQIPGLFYVDISSKPGRPEIHAKIDRLRAADMGLSVADIAATLRTAFAGSTDTKYREAGDEYDLRVQFRQFDRTKVADVSNLYVGQSRDGQPVRLADVATIEMSSGPSLVERYNRQRSTTVSAYLTPELPAGKAQQLIEAVSKKIAIPGVTFAWGGDVQMMGESFGYMGQAMLLSIILVYLVTAALYNSVLEPLNVMLTLPMAMVGALAGLYICHMNISVVAIIGFIMLMGIVGKNAILVVDYTNTLRKRGMSRTDALEAAGPHRMKPVLMTSIATIVGMLPTAIALNEGSEWRAPMAVAVIFGLALSTMLSLIVVPASYCIWDNVEQFMTNEGRWILARCLKKNGNCKMPEDPGRPEESGEDHE